MPGKAEILASVTETTTTDIEASRLCDDTRDDKDRNQRVQDQQAAAIENTTNDS